MLRSSHFHAATAGRLARTLARSKCRRNARRNMARTIRPATAGTPVSPSSAAASTSHVTATSASAAPARALVQSSSTGPFGERMTLSGCRSRWTMHALPPRKLSSHRGAAISCSRLCRVASRAAFRRSVHGRRRSTSSIVAPSMRSMISSVPPARTSSTRGAGKPRAATYWPRAPWSARDGSGARRARDRTRRCPRRGPTRGADRAQALRVA